MIDNLDEEKLNMNENEESMDLSISKHGMDSNPHDC